MARPGLNPWLLDPQSMFVPLLKLNTKTSWRGTGHRGNGPQVEYRNRVSGVFLKLRSYDLTGLYSGWSALLRNARMLFISSQIFPLVLSPPWRSLKVKWMKDVVLFVWPGPSLPLCKKRFFPELLTGIWVSKEPWPGSQEVWDPGLGVKRSWTLLTNHGA